MNGQSQFIIIDLVKKDIRYKYDLARCYEYDVDSLLYLDYISLDIETEIIGKISDKEIEQIKLNTNLRNFGLKK